MAAVDIQQRPNTVHSQRDELDDLFDYDAGIDDILKGLDSGNSAQATGKEPTATGRPQASNSTEGVGRIGLGIDEEVKVAKKRAPAAKLDETRLLSAAGIPKLRRISKDRLKFKGKGHEFSDMAQLLNMYQLWLDDLYPKAKFADGLSIIEKLGHTKRMQVMRKAWIDEGKPRQAAEEEEALAATGTEGATEPAADAGNAQVGDTISTEPTKELNHKQSEAEAMDAEGADGTAAPSNGFPEEDDLDALLADEATNSGGQTSSTPNPPNTARQKHPIEEEFADEMAVMDEMDMW